MLSKVYTNHIGRATANILSYPKEVWGVATFDFFQATETWSVINVRQFSPLVSWQSVVMFLRWLQSSKKFNTIVFTTLSTSLSNSKQSKWTAISQPPRSLAMKCLPTCSGAVISTLFLLFRWVLFQIKNLFCQQTPKWNERHFTFI